MGESHSDVMLHYRLSDEAAAAVRGNTEAPPGEQSRNQTLYQCVV